MLIDAFAATLHGSAIRTGDADITPASDRDNHRLAAALRDLDARIRTDAVPEGLPFNPGGEGLARGQIWNLQTQYGDLDRAFQPSGTEGYDDLAANAVTYEVGGVQAQVASLLDVIRSKEAAGRPKDHAMLPTLRKLLDRITREPK
ncbi:MAG: hypothetical protein ACRDZO_28445 [Egibacteraceae bacterium]